MNLSPWEDVVIPTTISTPTYVYPMILPPQVILHVHNHVMYSVPHPQQMDFGDMNIKLYLDQILGVIVSLILGLML